MSVRAIIAPEGDFGFRLARDANGDLTIGNSSTMDVSRFDMPRAAVQFFFGGGSTGSYTLQGSIDGTNFVDIETTITADTVVNFGEQGVTPMRNHFWRLLRINTVAVGLATDEITLGAYEYLGHGG